MLATTGSIRAQLVMATVCLAIMAIPDTAFAKDDLYVSGPWHVDGGVELGEGGVAVGGANFGLGRRTRAGTVTGDSSVFYSDSYAEPSVGLRFEPDSNFSAFAKASAVLAATRGDGDPAGFTDGREEDVDLEFAYGGIKWKDATDWNFELSGGAQDLKIGNGFLFWDGDFDTGKDSNYWAAPRSAFNWTGVAKAGKGPVAATAFVAEADKDNGNPQLYGGDLQWSPEFGTIGVTAAHIFKDDNGFGRDGLSLVSVRALDLAMPQLPKLKFSSEVAHEFGSGPVRDFDAWGAYGQIAYSFDLPWSPTLSYRYSYFSGGTANDPTRSFDPLFFGSGGGWGTWFQGEIAGEYYLFNSNEIAQQVKLSVSPTDKIGAGIMYFHFDLDKKQYSGTPISSTNFADEVNVYMDWTVTDNLYLGIVAGVAVPAKAAKQAFGHDDDTLLAEALAIYTY